MEGDGLELEGEGLAHHACLVTWRLEPDQLTAALLSAPLADLGRHLEGGRGRQGRCENVSDLDSWDSGGHLEGGL